MAKFLDSNKVKVFPTAFRGKDSNGYAINPEAFMTTENNLVNLTNKVTYNHKDYFFLDGNTVHIVIGGYYFVALKSDITALFTNPSTNDEIHACISISNLATSYSDISVPTLTPNGGSAGDILDVIQQFKGLTFEGKDDTTGLKLFKYDGSGWYPFNENMINIDVSQVGWGNTPISSHFKTEDFVGVNTGVANLYGYSGPINLYGDIVPQTISGSSLPQFNLGSYDNFFSSIYGRNFVLNDYRGSYHIEDVLYWEPYNSNYDLGSVFLKHLESGVASSSGGTLNLVNFGLNMNSGSIYNVDSLYASSIYASSIYANTISVSNGASFYSNVSISKTLTVSKIIGHNSTLILGSQSGDIQVDAMTLYASNLSAYAYSGMYIGVSDGGVFNGYHSGLLVSVYNGGVSINAGGSSMGTPLPYYFGNTITLSNVGSTGSIYLNASTVYIYSGLSVGAGVNAAGFTTGGNYIHAWHNGYTGVSAGLVFEHVNNSVSARLEAVGIELRASNSSPITLSGKSIYLTAGSGGISLYGSVNLSNNISGDIWANTAQTSNSRCMEFHAVTTGNLGSPLDVTFETACTDTLFLTAMKIQKVLKLTIRCFRTLARGWYKINIPQVLSAFGTAIYNSYSNTLAYLNYRNVTATARNDTASYTLFRVFDDTAITDKKDCIYIGNENSASYPGFYCDVTLLLK